jgi:hypothetical protein
MSSRKKSHNKNQGTIVIDDAFNKDKKTVEKNKHNDYLRNCLNCLKRNDCNKIPQKNSIKRHQEFCESFLPNYSRIDRIRVNQSIHTIMNPDSPSGQRAGIQATWILLGKVEEALNAIGKHD